MRDIHFAPQLRSLSLTDILKRQLTSLHHRCIAIDRVRSKVVDIHRILSPKHLARADCLEDFKLIWGKAFGIHFSFLLDPLFSSFLSLRGRSFDAGFDRVRFKFLEEGFLLVCVVLLECIQAEIYRVG